jgi:hypothetical protein
MPRMSTPIARWLVAGVAAGLLAIAVLLGGGFADGLRTKPPGAEAPLDSPGARLRADVLKTNAAVRASPPDLADREMTVVLTRFLPPGTAFDEARTVLTQAGFTVSPIPDPDKDPTKQWPFTADIVAILETPLGQGPVSATKLIVNLSPQAPHDYAKVGRVTARLHTSMS